MFDHIFTNKDSGECFDLHRAAVISKQNELKKSGIRKWKHPLKIDDSDLERKCFVEFHRELIETWRNKPPTHTWRVRVSKFDDEGRLEHSNEEFKIERVPELTKGEFLVAVYLGAAGIWKTQEPAGINLECMRGETFSRGGISGDSEKCLRDFEEFYSEASMEKIITYRRDEGGSIQKKTLHSMQCVECMSEIEKKGKIVGSEMTERAKNSIFTAAYLRRSLSVLDRVEGAMKEEIAQAMEQAFRAGQESFKVDHSMSLIKGADHERRDGKKPHKFSQNLSIIEKEIVKCWEKNPLVSCERILNALLNREEVEKDDTGKRFRYKGETEFVSKEAISNRIKRLKPKNRR